MLRTMRQLETDMAQHELTRMADLTALAVAANDADAAALFAVSAVRASRQLDAPEHGAELQAEPMLRCVSRSYVAEIKRAYAGDALLCADMLSELEAA